MYKEAKISSIEGSTLLVGFGFFLSNWVSFVKRSHAHCLACSCALVDCSRACCSRAELLRPAFFFFFAFAGMPDSPPPCASVRLLSPHLQQLQPSLSKINVLSQCHAGGFFAYHRGMVNY